jgi:hypothetical protein
MSETERAAVDQLGRLNGVKELRAAVLALLLPPGSKRALRAWQVECEGAGQAGQVRKWVGQLSGPARLPWFELLVSRMRGQPLIERQAMLAATRRVMGARGVARPIDRLHWLEMRQRLGEGSAADKRAAATTDLSQLPQADVLAIAMYSAFMARLVPADVLALEDSAPPDSGVAWYTSAMKPWEQNALIPRCKPPDTDGLVQSLQALQMLPWMQRPALVRVWTKAAQKHSQHGRLSDTTADALRMTCSLLVSPLPPELTRHYGKNEISG